MKVRTLVLVNYNLDDIEGYRETPYLFESDKMCIDDAKYAKVRNRNGNVKLVKVLNVVNTCDEEVVKALMTATGAKEPLCKVVSVLAEGKVEEGETNE